MKISEICGVSPNNADEFEAYDIELNADNKAFISVECIREAEGPLAERVLDILEAFFAGLAQAIADDDVELIKKYAQIGREQNAYHLGLSKKEPRGNGSSLELAIDEMKKSRIPFGPNMRLFAESLPIIFKGIDADRTSDILGSILFYPFVGFTIKVLDKYNVRYTLDNKKRPHYVWDANRNCPTKESELGIPCVDGIPVILVPEKFVEKRLRKNARGFFSKAVLDERKQRPDWPLTMPSTENGLTEARPMTKKEYFAANPWVDVKEEIKAEFEANPEKMSALLASYLLPKK